MFAIDDPLVRALALTHGLAQLGLVTHGVHRLSMLWRWRHDRQTSSGTASFGECTGVSEPAPRVTVQLPIYNERFVAARLIDVVAELDWPADRLQIQVLDDSTDETSGIVDGRVKHWKENGKTIEVVRRGGRRGYKAGALAAGLERATGEFVAIFDADFLPPRDFLRRTLGSFRDPAVGMVQARWGFVNAEHSWLTRAQAVSLGAHFRIEQQVRSSRGLFFNFNGTAGVWRRAAIDSAGGWRADTVTEDLDLSYRAQLAGWRFVYLDDVVVPSEVPVTLGALRAQQHRWAKGSMQTARRTLPRLWRAALPVRVKLEATTHLLGNLGWLLGAILLATLYPALLVHAGRGWQRLLAVDLPLLLGSTGAFLLYFLCAAKAIGSDRAWRSALLLPLVGVGLAPVVSAGVISGLVSRGGAFERTPKFGVRGRERLPRLAGLYHRSNLTAAVVNLVVLSIGIVPSVLAVRDETWAALPPLLLIPAACCVYGAQDLLDSGRMRSRRSS